MLDSHEINDIIERFRDWLLDTSEQLDLPDVAALSSRHGEFHNSAATPPSVGLLEVVETVTALRHDAKLQAKRMRTLQQTTEAALEGLHRATEQLLAAKADSKAAAERARKPLIHALLDVDEIVSHAAASLQADPPRQPVPAMDQLRKELDREWAELPRWRRIAGKFWRRAVIRSIDRLDRPPLPTSNPVAEGVQLLQRKVARLSADIGIKKLEGTGCKVDPTAMCVVEVVSRDDTPPETVVDVIRPGYQFGDQVIRIAEVRATRPHANR